MGSLIYNNIFRVYAWLKHYFTAINTLGNGVHSPHLYYLVNMLFYDKNTYYCFHDIEKQRKRLNNYHKEIHVTDFGTGKSGNRRISQIARTSLSTPTEAQLLFRLVNHIKPQHIIELGTSLGITTSYIAKAIPQSTIYTLEGSPEIAQEANKTFAKLKLNNIQQIVGNIDKTLDNVLSKLGTIDFAFLDANHTEEATWRYFNLIAQRCTQDSVVVLDDIHYSPDMHKAWQRIQQDKRVSCTMDLYSMGIVFFDKQYLHKHYRLRI